MKRIAFYGHILTVAFSCFALLFVSIKLSDQRNEAVVSATQGYWLAAVGLSNSRQCLTTMKSHDALYRAVSSVAAIPYANPGMNCYDHSKLVTKKLADEGIASSILINADRSHAWIAVWIDANTGAFVPPKNAYGPVIEMRAPDTTVILHR